MALVELKFVEQRYNAVCEALDGATVTDVALRKRSGPPDGPRLVPTLRGRRDRRSRDRSSSPATCPHQISPELEAKVVELRRAHTACASHDSVFPGCAIAVPAQTRVE